MKLILAALSVAFISVGTPVLAADVGVSVSIGDPGFYGRIDIGDYPQPQVIYREPRIVERRVYVEREPLYLRVPPGHAKHWSKHCRKYNACGERVYFVQDNWYQQEYAPRYKKQHGGDRHDDRGDQGDRGDRGDREDRGDRGHGNKHDKHKGNKHKKDRDD